jgi:hypothetical protein
MQEKITINLEAHTIATLHDLAGVTNHTESQLIDLAVDLLAGYMINPPTYEEFGYPLPYQDMK